MNKDSANNRHSPALRRRKIDTSQTQQSPLAAKDGRTRTRKRKASPDKETHKKKTRVFKAEPCNTSEEDVTMLRVKRKVIDDGEGPAQKKRRMRAFDLQLDDREAASSSVDTGRGSSSSSNPLEGCSKSLGVRGVKRKANDDGEGPARKKKRSPDLKETKEDFTSSADTSREIDSSRTQQSPLAAKDGRTRTRKRKASPDKETPKNKTRVFKAEPCNTSEEDVTMLRVKRKVRDDGEGPAQKKRKMRAFDLQLDDKEAASSSVDTGRGSSSSSNPLEGCSKSLGVRGVKRKANDDGEGPARKKKRSPDLKETKVDFTSSADAYREIDSSRTQQSPLAAKDGRTRTRKRKASPDKETPKNKTRVFKAEPCNTSEEDVTMLRVKRKVRDDGEGPAQKKRRMRAFDLQLDDKEAASSSVDTGRGSSSSSNPLEGCSKSLGVTGVKKKANNDGEGSVRKKKRSPDLKETKVDFTSSVDTSRAAFEAKYEQENQIGEGGCGTVFAGYRKADNLPVAIKHVPANKMLCKQIENNGKKLSLEVAVMLKLGMSGSAGHSAPVSLLDWYDFDQELILVLERPVPSVDLFEYTEGGSLEEEEAKLILKQLLDAAIELQDECIFHRDIKMENILIQTGTDTVPRVRLIDFGLSCFVKKGSFYRIFSGTLAHVPPEWYVRGMYRAGPTTAWQLGIVLFEMLHRNLTFDTEEFLSNKLKISKKLSKDCQDFMRICLTVVPEQRPTLEQLQCHPWLR